MIPSIVKLRRSWQRLRTLTRVNLIVGDVLLLVFMYTAVTVYFGAASQVRYESNDFPGAKKASTAFLALSPFERHIGYFNRGTAEAAVGDFEPARTDLETALKVAPTRDECAVRVNLSYVYEKLADEIATEDAKKSDELYAQALQTLEDAPKECRPDKSEEQQKSSEAKKRVEEKKNAEPSDGSSGGGKQDQNPGDKGDEKKGPGEKDKKQPGSGDDQQKSEEEKKREELEKRAEQSEREQQQQGDGGQGGRTTPDKPW